VLVRSWSNRSGLPTYRPTRDPAQVHAILPFGGYKGFALALAMQALGVLAGSAQTGPIVI